MVGQSYRKQSEGERHDFFQWLKFKFDSMERMASTIVLEKMASMMSLTHIKNLFTGGGVNSAVFPRVSVFELLYFSN